MRKPYKSHEREKNYNKSLSTNSYPQCNKICLILGAME